MSIDLSKATAISDQYGAWKQIADASGRVLWSAVKMPMITIDTDASSGTEEDQAKVTLTFPEAIEYPLMSGCYIESLYLDANSSYDGLAFEVPAGTLAKCTVKSSYGTPSITLNGTNVSSGGYTHEITKNVSFYLKVKNDGGKGIGSITITET